MLSKYVWSPQNYIPFLLLYPFSSLSKPNSISSFPPPPFLLPLLPPSLSRSLSPSSFPTHNLPSATPLDLIFEHVPLPLLSHQNSPLPWTGHFQHLFNMKVVGIIRVLKLPVALRNPEIPSIPIKSQFHSQYLGSNEDNHLGPHVIVQERKEQATWVRVCNYMKFETGQNFPPVLKIVTRTALVRRNKPSC